ncbi:MAG: ACT domain-containing protein [Clostridia bacterium]|nr:ACT domain-containing protein [Clostridia bacterium]
MKSKYLLVDKEILPECYLKVMEAKELLLSGKAKDITEASKIIGIARSTYYKYKDYVFAPNSDTECRKAVISFTLYHKSGILSLVLNELSEKGVNILTITQNLPVNQRANVVISMDVSHVEGDISVLLDAIGAIDGVSSAKLLAIE